MKGLKIIKKYHSLQKVMHAFCNQTEPTFTKELLSTLSIPMSEEKLMQVDGQELFRPTDQVTRPSRIICLKTLQL